MKVATYLLIEDEVQPQLDAVVDNVHLTTILISKRNTSSIMCRKWGTFDWIWYWARYELKNVIKY